MLGVTELLNKLGLHVEETKGQELKKMNKHSRILFYFKN